MEYLKYRFQIRKFQIPNRMNSAEIQYCQPYAQAGQIKLWVFFILLLIEIE